MDPKPELIDLTVFNSPPGLRLMWPVFITIAVLAGFLTGFQPPPVAAAGGALLLVRRTREPKDVYGDVDWSLLLLFLGLFLIIGGVASQGTDSSVSEPTYHVAHAGHVEHALRQPDHHWIGGRYQRGRESTHGDPHNLSGLHENRSSSHACNSGSRSALAEVCPLLMVAEASPSGSRRNLKRILGADCTDRGEVQFRLQVLAC